MDNHPAALERTQLLAQRQGVKVECVCIDLRKADLSGWSADIAHGHRFLDRTLIHEVRLIYACKGLVHILQIDRLVISLFLSIHEIGGRQSPRSSTLAATLFGRIFSKGVKSSRHLGAKQGS